MKYKAHWYNQDTIVPSPNDDKIIIANSIEEATKLAYMQENGNPPAPLLWLEEVK